MGFTAGLFRDVWESVANRGLDLLGKSFAMGPSSLAALCRDLLTERGEASGAALARKAAELYALLDEAGRITFFGDLLDPRFLPDKNTVLAAAERYKAKSDSAALAALFDAVEPPRQELFRRLNLAPGGTRWIVQLREDVLKLLPKHPELKPIDADLRHLLASWFNRGFLRLERIDWRTPALVLEKLIEHEAVHEIQGWDDLHRRLQSDRRCFAFFHPALPEEPLIFVEVALTRGLPDSIQALLEKDGQRMDASKADTAVFYSISNCLDGLRGISFGNFLIKQVVAELEAEKLPVRTFVTLSPIPGFRKWVLGLNDARRAAILGGADSRVLRIAESPEAARTPKMLTPLRPELLRLCAHYLLNERKDERTLDPVAAFHLGNGAAVEQIDWMADTSEKGLKQSFGIMANYIYRPWQIERNHEAYVKKGRVVAAARVKQLLEPPPVEK
ncbi:MAG: malonyl-CoA decarboxylase [Bryobacteraceae bacterium]